MRMLSALVVFLSVFSTGLSAPSSEADFQDGRHKFVWPSGDEYDGEWKDGMKHGRGTIVWSDGDR